MIQDNENTKNKNRKMYVTYIFNNAANDMYIRENTEKAVGFIPMAKNTTKLVYFNKRMLVTLYIKDILVEAASNTEKRTPKVIRLQDNDVTSVKTKTVCMMFIYKLVESDMFIQENTGKEVGFILIN